MSQPNEYSPNNNTSQNIDIYQRNKINQTQYSSNISREQSMYEPYSLHTPYQSENYFSTPNQNLGYLLNNQNFSQNYINNLNNEKNIFNIKNEMNNNSKNDIKENKNNENEDNVQDPDEKLFEKEEDKKKDELQNGEEEPLSSESDKNSDNEKEYTDHLLAQYDKVKRVKNKWKVYLKGCVVQKDKKELICGRVTGDLEREW